MAGSRGVVGMFYVVLAAVITLAISILIMRYMYERAASAGKSAGDTGVKDRVVTLCTRMRETGPFEVADNVQFQAKVGRDEIARHLMTYCFPGASPSEIQVEDGCSGEGRGHVIHWCAPEVLQGTVRLTLQASSDRDYDLVVRAT